MGMGVLHGVGIGHGLFFDDSFYSNNYHCPFHGLLLYPITITVIQLHEK